MGWLWAWGFLGLPEKLWMLLSSSGLSCPASPLSPQDGRGRARAHPLPITSPPHLLDSCFLLLCSPLEAGAAGPGAPRAGVLFPESRSRCSKDESREQTALIDLFSTAAAPETAPFTDAPLCSLA